MIRGELRDADVSSELNLQGWLGGRNLRLVAADRAGLRSPRRSGLPNIRTVAAS